MGHIEFDPQVVKQHATRLYAESDKIVRNWTVMGALVGYVSGAAVAGPAAYASLLVTAVLAVMGYIMGHERARMMRLEAQLALCQIRIEQHSRGWIAESRLTFRKLGHALDTVADGVADATTDRDEAPATETEDGTAEADPTPAPQRGTNAPQDVVAPLPTVRPGDEISPDMFFDERFYEDVAEGPKRAVPSGSPVHSAARTFIDDDEVEGAAV